LERAGFENHQELEITTEEMDEIRENSGDERNERGKRFNHQGHQEHQGKKDGVRNSD
jgi:hypothetical protein